MDYNFKVLFSQFNPTVEQMKAMFQDLWRKNDENQTEISKLHRENEANRSKISELKNEIELLKMIAVNDEPSCPVCLEKFDRNVRRPYALSCAHMVCAQCLSPALKGFSLSFIRSCNENARRRPGCALMREPTSLNNSDNISDERHPSKQCPVCRTQVTTELKVICLRS